MLDLAQSLAQSLERGVDGRMETVQALAVNVR